MLKQDTGASEEKLGDEAGDFLMAVLGLSCCELTPMLLSFPGISRSDPAIGNRSAIDSGLALTSFSRAYGKGQDGKGKSVSN